MIEIMSSKQTRKENADKGELRRQSSNDIKKKKKKTHLWKELIAGQTGWLQGHTVLVQKGLEGEGGSRAGLLSPGRMGAVPTGDPGCSGFSQATAPVRRGREGPG